ncbi:MAG: urea ABC transporter permease subunit UrtB, partial [Aestuariivirga sp.]
ISNSERDATLSANMKDGKVGGLARDALNTSETREEAYDALVEAGTAKPFVHAAARALTVSKFTFYDVYNEPSSAVTSAARSTVNAIDNTVKFDEIVDLVLDAVSLASIYFLAAIGLAITFGVMRVINMAHGEFIMIGAYTGYVVQQWVTDYTTSIIIALPLAFVITFAAGIVLERLVIRHLVHRPLETLLATFGISIALQQIAKNIFGTQARPLTSPAWLGGALHFNDIISISYIRVAIFVLAIIFFSLLLFILNKTRLGLEVRAVTQNRRMAASMGINPDRINMLTFGLGSGIAGIAGVAIGLYAQVTSEIGSNYIVMSFMAVVVGGVGNIWGTLAGAGLTGIMQKIIEWFNPSNTLAAQTFMIIFIIIFIQFRPRGIIALKGRAAGD